MSTTITLEIKPAPELTALIDKLLSALAPKTFSTTQPLPQSPAEQAVRMRMQQAPAPQRPAPTYAPTPQQYRPQPAPAPTAPYAPVVPMTQSTAQQRPSRSTNPTPAPRPTGSAPTTPMPAGRSTAQPAPVAAAPVYTQEQLARATATLADAGKYPQIQQLFQRFGIQQLTALPKERYGEYATALRQMGVRI